MSEMRSPMIGTFADSLFAQGQIRLAELSVYHWGSFHGLHNVAIDPLGTLITGDNGAGKSTLIDGLMALLQPAGRASFNTAAAQGDRTDRSLMSYIRGDFGTEHDGAHTRAISKREGATATALRALYRADDGSVVTLAALFWITTSSNALSDLKRVYLVATREVGLPELLKVFAEGDARALKQFLREDPAITPCDDRFSEYQQAYRQLLHMENRNAPALLSRALGLKKVDDLTLLIRDLVLEPSTVREDTRLAVTEFDDLRAIHDQLLDARRQQQALASLPETYQRAQHASAELESLGHVLRALPAFLGAQCATLWQVRIDQLTQTLEQSRRVLANIEVALHDAARDVEARHADYLQHGGERIETLRRELEHAKQRLQHVNATASRYQQASKALNLDSTLDEHIFDDNRRAAQTWLAQLSAIKEAAQNAFGDAAAALGNTQSTLREQTHELSEIERRPQSNIDPRYQRLRDEMIATLGIRPSHLMFVGELIEVHPEQRLWQGAIERALGGLRTTLAVPEKQFSLVTAWLNERHTGLHVRAQVARPVSGQAQFKTDGYLRKLQWREHPYREWLKHLLARVDLSCVADTSTLDRTPFSLTREGLIHRAQGRFEKRDVTLVDDRRDWAIGFSNADRIALLRSDIANTQEQIQTANTRVQSTRAELDTIDVQHRAWERLGEYPFDDINVAHWDRRVSTLGADLQALEAKESSTAQAKQRWEHAKVECAAIEAQRADHLQQTWRLDTELERARHEQQQATSAAAQGAFSDTTRDELAARITALTDHDLDTVVHIEHTHRQRLDHERDGASKRQAEFGQRAVRIVATFRSHWEIIAAEWAADLSAVPVYINYFNELISEGLPELVEQFKERLNRHTTQSLAGLREKIESERDDIRARIELINDVLQRTEFRPGSFLRLQSRKDLFAHVQDFEKQLRLTFEQATAEDDPETRFTQLQRVIEVLDKASNPTTAGTLESLRLLDPRYQMSFYAEELDRQSNEVRDVLNSSSGKSGGEKEAFAGTIVAASLAYVLTPDGADRPIYCTVFLDEAFSNTAEAVSRRVLRVFRELHVHVNLITPFKNLNLARESARSLIIAERDMERHESRLYEVTWEEVDRRLQEQADTETVAQASALGIELETMQ